MSLIKVKNVCKCIQLSNINLFLSFWKILYKNFLGQIFLTKSFLTLVSFFNYTKIKLTKKDSKEFDQNIKIQMLYRDIVLKRV